MELLDDREETAGTRRANPIRVAETVAPVVIDLTVWESEGGALSSEEVAGDETQETQIMPAAEFNALSGGDQIPHTD